MSTKNNILISIFLIIIALAIGYYFGATQLIPSPGFLKKQMPDQLPADKLAEFERYKKAIEMMFPQASGEIFAASGNVKEVRENYIIIEAPLVGEVFLPGEESKTEEIKIIVNENTKLIKINPLLPPLIIPKPGEEPIMPKEETFKLPDLKIGDSIFAESSENIKNKKEFTATRATLYLLPEERLQNQQ